MPLVLLCFPGSSARAGTRRLVEGEEGEDGGGGEEGEDEEREYWPQGADCQHGMRGDQRETATFSRSCKVLEAGESAGRSMYTVAVQLNQCHDRWGPIVRVDCLSTNTVRGASKTLATVMYISLTKTYRRGRA